MQVGLWIKEDGDVPLREIKEEEIKRLPDEIFSFQGFAENTVCAFIDEKSMLKYTAERYANDLNYIKPTR